MPRRLAAIVFTDLVGSTELAQTNEAVALDTVREQERLVRPLVERQRGRWVKSMGDGMLFEFPTARAAVEFAVEFLKSAQERRAEPAGHALRLRIGIHLGDVERRGTDIVGDAVNVASRIESAAEPGGICLSSSVYQQVVRKVPYQFERIGARSLKGVLEPLELYRVVLPWSGSAEGSGRPPAKPAAAIASASRPELPLPRLAVLPLSNISPDPADAFFAEGLTEELIAVISRVRGIRVISRTSVGQYRNTTKPVAVIGSELGTDFVLEGSVRKAGDDVRITLQLIDARADEHRWAETYERRLDRVFALQAEVAEATASALSVTLAPNERKAVRSTPTSSVEAHAAYLRGIAAARRFGEGDPESDATACAAFEEALRIDPDFGLAQAAYSDYLVGAMGLVRSYVEVADRARKLATEALLHSPDAPEAYAAIGNYRMQVAQDWEGAEEAFRQAIERNPSHVSVHLWYGILLLTTQRYEEAERECETAVALDPLWFIPRMNRVTVALQKGELARAVPMARDLTSSFPTNPVIRLWLAVELTDFGLLDEARRALADLESLRAPRSQPAADALGQSHLLECWECLARAGLGEPAAARAFLARWEAGELKGYLGQVQRAELHAALGDDDRALELLEEDVRSGEHSFWFSYQSPRFDRLRSSPRFQELLRAMRLPRTPPPRLARKTPGLDAPSR